MKTTYYEEIVHELKSKGFRLTRIRKAVIEELDLAKKPLTAAEIIILLEKHGLQPHKTSVYRELNFMLTEGLIIKITFGDKQDRFELSTLEHHHHAVCEKCGGVEDVDCLEGMRMIEKQLAAKNFKINAHMLEFFGLCDTCRHDN
jgi:Fe2+ or Zn2+ uptake regulation protein